MTDSSEFDAAASMLGFLYQVRFALHVSLQKLTTVDDPDSCFLALEMLDDISFADSGSAVELLQTKYHGKPANLTDRSADIWKTVRVWAETIKQDPTVIDSHTYTLLTTENAEDGTLACYLGVDDEKRDVKKALSLMQAISKETSNKTNEKGYAAFSSLNSLQQLQLLTSIYVVSSGPSIADVLIRIDKDLRPSVTALHLIGFRERLEGIWFDRSIRALTSDEAEKRKICLGDIWNDIDDLRTQFLPENLPADYEHAMPPIVDVENDNRLFLDQLRLIDAGNQVLERGIVNYYRAEEQRSRWAKESLLNPGEMKTYLKKLTNEFEDRKALLSLKIAVGSPEDKIKFGRELYIDCQAEGSIPIRPMFTHHYVARGSYLDLSDRKCIGWHPDFGALLPASNEDDEVA